jgi:dipeptidyl aminopeptidase/acylaminoacyl peptidase
VIPHGGPTSLYANGFSSPRDWGQHLAARGIAVLLPNFRGSTGWGIEFAEANVGDMGGKDFQDVMTGVDAMIARGLADPRRLGIGGWSYGGFMTAWAITQTDRFKAAVVGAGIANWLSFHGNSHLNTWDAIHYGASPYERDGVFQKFSAMNYVSRVRTPTLILHGELDRDVPPEQGYQLYRALKDHQVETQFVLYPREEHNISETKHVHDLLRRVLDWFENHLT